jgi:hypothetical protein
MKTLTTPVELEVFTALTVMSIVFWDGSHVVWYVYHGFEGIYCRLLGLNLFYPEDGDCTTGTNINFWLSTWRSWQQHSSLASGIGKKIINK